MSAADLQVLAGGALEAPMLEIAANYEKASGQKLAIRFGTTPVLIGLATSTSFDLGVVPVDVMRDAAARARFDPKPTTDIVRVGLGIAVRSGATKPGIGTADALKAALLQAKSVATIPASAGGTQVLRMFEAFGISEAMKAKIVPKATPPLLVQGVAAGEAELGIFLRNVLTAPGLDVVGPVPAGLHTEVVFTAALARDTTAAEAATAFLTHLKSPLIARRLAERGLTPA